MDPTIFMCSLGGMKVESCLKAHLLVTRVIHAYFTGGGKSGGTGHQSGSQFGLKH